MSSSKIAIENALQSLLPSFNLPFPKELIELSNTLISNSRVKVVGLRTDEEIARTSLCCYLAVEKLKDKYNFPPPSVKRVPMPPRSYQNLLALFNNSLFNKRGMKSNPSTPTRRSSPLKRSIVPDSGSPTPVRRKRLNFDDTKPDLTSLNGIDNKSKNEEDENDNNDSDIGTPKRSPIKRRGLAKDSDPNPQDVYQIANGLKISEKATEAIVFGYQKYNNLVKERWGLLCGLFYVITSRVHPELLFSQPNLQTLILSYAGDKSRMNEEKLTEWIIWADKILADQSWIKNISVSVKRRPIGDSTRKVSSGIGNMITYGFTFTNEKNKQMYEEWKEDIMRMCK